MNVETIVVGAFEVNCHVVWEAGSPAFVIDPGADAEAIAEVLSRRRLAVAAYLLTHGHVDHISALADLCDRLAAPVGLHPADARWAFTGAGAMPPFYPAPRRPACEARALREGQRWTAGALVCEVLETPGHAPGACCFLFRKEAALFTGDTLFAGSVGRTDLPGGDSSA